MPKKSNNESQFQKYKLDDRECQWNLLTSEEDSS